MATLTLLVTGASVTNLTPVPGGSANWQCVAEVPENDDTYVIAENSATYLKDLYVIQNPTASATSAASAPDKITVYFRCKESPQFGDGYAQAIIGSGGSQASGNETPLIPSIGFTDYSADFTVDPATSSAWTWDAIDSLIAGIALRDPTDEAVYCSEIYVEVTYNWYKSLSDGINISDTAPITGTKALLDGAKLSDTEPISFTGTKALLDGAKLSDTEPISFTGTKALLEVVNISDIRSGLTKFLSDAVIIIESAIQATCHWGSPGGIWSGTLKWVRNLLTWSGLWTHQGQPTTMWSKAGKRLTNWTHQGQPTTMWSKAGKRLTNWIKR